MNFPWIILGLLTLVRLLFAALGHVGETESYLLLCSHHLDWGFVEGPAGIPSLMRLSEMLFGHAPMAFRWLSPLLLFGASWILWRWTIVLCSRKVAFWTVVVFNLLPLANAAGVVMEGTMVITISWLAALQEGWTLMTNRVQKNKISSWVIFGLTLAIGTQVTYQIGWLMPLVALASSDFFHNEISAEYEMGVTSSAWRKFFGILAAMLLLAITWFPIFWWNKNHDWIQWQEMTWDSFWSWPPAANDYFQYLPVAWSLLLLVPLVIAGVCCFSGVWSLENCFFLILAVPFFFCINELGHGKVPFALLLVMTALFLPATVEIFFQKKRKKTVGLLLLFSLACLSFLFLFEKVSSSVTQESSWNFPSATGVIGIEDTGKKVFQLRETYAGTSGKSPFLIAETPGLAALLGAVLPIAYSEMPEAPSVFVPESPALVSQFLLWSHYADATITNITPDPLYSEEKEISPFLGDDAFYITTEKLEEIPQTVTGAFSSIIPLSVTFSLSKNGKPEQLNVYLCQTYQMLSL